MSGRDRAPAPPLRVIGIGASAGGLEALREMLSPAQVPTGFAFVIVQHLDPNHESLLAQLLKDHTTLAVLQAKGGERVAADIVYIIPPGHGLRISGGVLELTTFAQPRGLRRPIDDFFVSLAGDQQANAACVILSGTGTDGTLGVRAIKESGGVCVVQDPGTARYNGMPVSAVGTGMVDFVKAPDDIIDCLATFFRRTGEGDHGLRNTRVEDVLGQIGSALRSGIGHDFTGYKQSTLVRRIERRMHVLGIAVAGDYAQRVSRDADEQRALLRDLLINVTQFFRDPDHFETLRQRVIDPLVRERASGDEVRVWVPGCSSGEEAYSIAMLFAESIERQGTDAEVQVFATDIDEQMLQIARGADYPLSAISDVPLAFRERFLVPHPDRFAIAASIRQMVRFASHSLIKDPPFSRIDLISCRNLLIYFNEDLQRAVLPLMARALRPGGTLFLGPSESIGRAEHLFAPLDAQARLFTRSSDPSDAPLPLPEALCSGRGRSGRGRSGRERSPSDGPDTPAQPRQPAGTGEEIAVTRIIESYAPASLVLDQDERIVEGYGPLGRFFDFPVTRSSGPSVIALARPGLRNTLGGVLREVRSRRRRTIVRDVTVRLDHGEQVLDIVVDPLRDGTLLVVLREAAPFRPRREDEFAEFETAEDQLGELEQELLATRHRLRSANEELETANEELKSSNEEMMSMNEELITVAAQTKELMLREMNHRVKNLFAVIGGMISAGARTHEGVTGFAGEMRERIAALGRAHSLALPTDEQPETSLAELLDSVLAPYRDLARINLTGPELYLRFAYVSPIALVFHEWASNSVKYGALGAPDGRLEVGWRRSATGLTLHWTERSSRSGSIHERAGFGTQLVNASLRQLAAKLSRKTTGDAFALEIALPPQVFADA